MSHLSIQECSCYVPRAAVDPTADWGKQSAMLASEPEYSQKRSGAYFTPDAVAASLVSWVCREQSDRLLDPSCGDGQFLSLHRNSVGIEQNPISAHQAIDRAPWALVHEGDFFTWASDTAERFDAAAGNPPFIRYQTFKGDMRKRAISLCNRLGANFSGLASSWAPFLVATAGLLKPNGRIAFVVPAEVGHAPYAVPLMEFLVRSFSTVKIIAIREKLFPTLSEDCWLLFASGYGECTDHIKFTVVDRFRPSPEPPRTQINISVDEWQRVWNGRLRPYVLSAEIRNLYKIAQTHKGSYRLRDFADVGIGYVSGDNDFFHLRPSEAKRWNIPSRFLQPSLRSGRSMPNGAVTNETVANWEKRDEKMLLLRLSRGQELTPSVQAYLDSSFGKQARQAYKCRNRTPWYSVPDVHAPDFIMSYMAGRSANLIANEARVTCTNSVHSVRLRNTALAAKLLRHWSSPFVQLSCEIEGHALGGGMLKIEPREAGRILFPAEPILQSTSVEMLQDAVARLQRWRHYAD